jgi:hypothetical protein
MTAGGELTVAGLLALGPYPQQYLPRMVVQVAFVTDRLGRDHPATPAAAAAPDASNQAEPTGTIRYFTL